MEIIKIIAIADFLVNYIFAAPMATSEAFVLTTDETTSNIQNITEEWIIDWENFIANETLEINSTDTNDLYAITQTTSTITETNCNKTEETNYDNFTMNPLEDTKMKLPDIYEMNITSNVRSRFAKTQVTTKIRNPHDDAQEVRFLVVLPETAYISGFVMEIDGKIYEAYITEKEEATNIYEEAVKTHKSAGQVSTSYRDSAEFTISINLEGHVEAIFCLTYEELLQRTLGQYEIVLNVNPGQPVEKMNVQVHIDEVRPLKFVNVPSLRAGNEINKNRDGVDPKADIKIFSDSECVVSFNPDIEKQKQLASGLGRNQEEGFSGQFVVQYDVEHDPYGGEVLIEDGYFIHFFAPMDLTPLSKLVIFILDTSGSMEGHRIKQMKEAMHSIIYQLNEGDVFHIVDFSSSVRVWNISEVEIQYVGGEDPWLSESEKEKQNDPYQTLPNAFDASEYNKEKAKQVLEKFDPYGGTNIQLALEIGLLLVREHEDEKNRHQPLIIFLTDGEPTVGETSLEKIALLITELNQGRTPMYCLSLGDDADRNFLRELSLKNSGFSRHIYEAADTYLQIENFYREISCPLLKDVNFHYVDNSVSKVTRTNFPIFFEGSELIVVGETGENFQPGIVVSGVLSRGNITFKPQIIETKVPGIEKIWAYLMLRQVLEARELAQNKTRYTDHALRIAMQYSFVSAVTSLVVVRPNDTETRIDIEDASEGLHNDEADDGIIIADMEDRVDHGIEEFGISLSIIDEEIASSDKNLITHYLPWLESIENGDGTITLPTGTYLLDDKEISKPNESYQCFSAPMNTSYAACLPIAQCTQIHCVLTSFEIYMEYFCPLNRVAGVCCPL